MGNSCVQVKNEEREEDHIRKVDRRYSRVEEFLPQSYNQGKDVLDANPNSSRETLSGLQAVVEHRGRSVQSAKPNSLLSELPPVVEQRGISVGSANPKSWTGTSSGPQLE